MKYLKKFFEHKISIFNQDWVKLLPETLEIVTDNGNFVLKKSQLTINDAMYQFSYYQSDVFGEPDFLEFDIYIVKNNDGDVSNSDKLKIDVDITYGDAMVSEFTIMDNKVNIIHYTGKGSKYDPDTFFGFTDDSLEGLIKFFNAFGFSLTMKDFLFIDKENDDFSKSINENIDIKLNDISSYLSDISLEAEDIGYIFNYEIIEPTFNKAYHGEDKYKLIISLKKKGNKEKSMWSILSELDDVIEHINSYVKSNSEFISINTISNSKGISFKDDCINFNFFIEI